MTTGLAYSSGTAFRAALRDRFKTVVMTDPRYTFNELQRHFAYDRALARCFSGPDANQWVLKGAGALLARLEQARHSKDVDLFYAERAAAADEAESALLRALDQDIGDHFIFERVRSFALPEAAKGRRVHVSARLGGKVYAAFHIDVVVGTTMSGEPDTVPPLTPIELPGLVRPAYRAFPLEDHIADKLSATVETHRQAGEDRPSTRVKDLVDLALIATTQRVSAARLREAIRAGFAIEESRCRVPSLFPTKLPGGPGTRGSPRTRRVPCLAMNKRSGSLGDDSTRSLRARRSSRGIP